MANPFDALEPWAIMNPSPKQYKFLFQSAFTEEAQKEARDFIEKWLLEIGKYPDRMRIKNAPHRLLFEVKVWTR